MTHKRHARLWIAAAQTYPWPLFCRSQFPDLIGWLQVKMTRSSVLEKAMRRRDFITALGGAAIWPFAARAQQRGPVRLAFIPLGSPSSRYDRSLVEAFQRGLRRVSLIENQDVALDVVWPGDRPDQAVSEALKRDAELLIPCGSSASVAAKRQTSTIPIVFLSVGDPVAVGLVESLSRPGQNATGFSDILAELSGKLVDVTRELIKPHRIIFIISGTQRGRMAKTATTPRRRRSVPQEWSCNPEALLKYPNWMLQLRQ
jgi:ABC transporter substrate binding protein